MESATSPEEAFEVLRPLVEDGLAIVQTAVTQLEGLWPPDEVADAHAAFVDSIRASLSALQGLVDDYDELGFEGVIGFIPGGGVRGS